MSRGIAFNLPRWNLPAVMTSQVGKPSTVAIIQARMKSSRLPGKSMEPLLGSPMIERVIRRVRQSRLLSEAVLATTTEPEDDAVESVARKLGVRVFRGSAEDCLDRYWRVAERLAPDVVVRLTGDNPLVDGTFVDQVLEDFHSRRPRCDYLDSRRPGSFPVGMAVEVFGFKSLEAAWRETTNPSWRHHVTPFLYYHPERFRIGYHLSPEDWSHIRFTVDYPEDLNLVRRIFEYFGRDDFSWREAVTLVEAHPDWLDLNRHLSQVIVDP